LKKKNRGRKSGATLPLNKVNTINAAAVENVSLYSILEDLFLKSGWIYGKGAEEVTTLTRRDILLWSETEALLLSNYIHTF
jgi:hypothetical protein